jgi:hypothetical protein
VAQANVYERVAYSCLMLYGIMIFGNLLSELAEINRAARVTEMAKMERVQAAMEFMSGGFR